MSEAGSWEISLSILKVQCAIFNVADIARAHDWHIALVELRQKVDELTKKGKTDREAFRVAVDEAYEADPELRLVLGFRVSIREAREASEDVYRACRRRGRSSTGPSPIVWRRRGSHFGPLHSVS